MSIFVNLFAFLTAAVGPLAAQVLIALGMGVISFAAIATTLGAILSSAQGYFTGLGSYAFAFASLAGFGEGLGIIAGAMVFKAAYLALPRLGIMPISP